MQPGPTRSQIRKVRKTLVAALVLAWATQTLVSQWAGGAEPPPAKSSAKKPAEGGIVTVVMRDDAKVTGGAVRLGDVCRLLSEGDAPKAGDGRAVGDLVLAYRDPDAAAVTVGIEQVIRLLGDNGVGAARVRFQGPIRCQVAFAGDAPAKANASAAVSQEVGLLEWAGEPVPEQLAPAAEQNAAPAEQNAPPADAFTDAAPASPRDEGGVKWGENDWSPAGTNGPLPLAELLRRDLADRLNLPADGVQLRFRDPSAAYLDATGVAASQVRPTRAADLGPVAWVVTLDGRSVDVAADATAEVTRLSVAQPVGRGQIIRAADVVSQPATIRRTGDRGLTLAEVVGQEAARTLDVGDVLTGNSLAPRMLVRRGQYVSVTLVQNGLELRTLDRALDDGGYGQTVKVKNDTTGEILHVVVTGPQTGTLVDVTGR